jgi:hypothetical protein
MAGRIANDCFRGRNIFSTEGTGSLPGFTHARRQVPHNQWDRGLKNQNVFARDESDDRGLPGTKLPSF